MCELRPWHWVLIAALLLALAACTAHPPGESEERRASLAAGKAFENRQIPPLSDHPTREQLVDFALVNNADLEQQYWQWRSAIEQIPIDGTQATNLAISLGTTLNNGGFALDRTTASVGNDPMTDIVLPPKLSTAARRSLENARAAGVRFRKAQFELRRKVLAAYDDYALNAQFIRLAQRNIDLLQTTADITDARNRAGMAGQQDVLRARNEVEMARNDFANMQSQLPSQLAAINALLNRTFDAAIVVPENLPATRPIAISDQQLLDRASEMNPELVALADEIRGKQQEIQLAKLQYYPDFSVSASTDLQGIAQSLLGQFTLPIFRYEALHAAVEQAEANLRTAEAMRRQRIHDLAAQFVDDITTLGDADRQIDLIQNTILPRANQVVALTRAAYQANNSSLLDLLDAQRSLIDLERLICQLQVTRDKRLLDIESIEAVQLGQNPV